MELYKRPSDYCGPDYYDCYCFIGRHRDSSLVEASNWDAITRDMEKKFGEEECGPYGDEEFDVQGKLNEDFRKPATWFTIRDSHWAVGWVETLYIHKDAKEIVEWATEVQRKLKEDYPVYDDDLYSSMEWEQKQKYWDGCSPQERVELLHRARQTGRKWNSKLIPENVDQYIRID